jgi:hypothetical protein
MLVVCLLTAFSVTKSRCAMATFDRPSAIRARTSRSRADSRVIGSSRARRPSNLDTTSGSITVPPDATVRIASTNWSSLKTRSLSR